MSESGAPRLVGRDAELAAARDLIEAVRRGRPAVLELTGPVGIGKTALLDAVADEAAATGARLLRARAAAFEQDVPYAIWVQLLDDAVEQLPPGALAGLGAERRAELARILPALAAGDDATGAARFVAEPAADHAAGAAELVAQPAADHASSAARFRLHRAVAALIATLAARRPLVLALDDLHWADPAGLELVLHLLRNAPAAPVLLLLASRPGAAADLLAEAGRDVTHRTAFELSPLAAADAAALVAAASAPDAAAAAPTDAADQRDLLARAAGNPLFLLELAEARGRGETLPRTVRAAVESALRELGADARALLDGAALVGDPFDVRLAALAGGVAGADADSAVDELLRGGVVALDDDLRCRFRHPLVRETTHAALGLERRRAGHAAIAAALGARDDEPAVLAPHVAASAQPGDERAVALLAAAARDVRAVAPDAAARWLDAAERLLPAAADGDRRRELRLRRSLALAACGRSAEAHDVLLAVHDALPPGSPLAVPAVVQLAQIERAGGRAHDARARLERALATGVATTPAEEARLRVGLAFSLAQLSDREAGAAVRAALAAAERADSLLEIASARACASVLAAWEGDHATAAAAVEQALAELGQVGDAELTEGLETVHLLGLMAIAHERFAPADALLARGETLARRSGQDLALAQLCAYRGMSRWNLCDVDGALEAVAEAIEIARLLRAEALLGHALAIACHLHVRAGDRAAGERAGAEALRIVARQQPDILTAISRLNASLFMALDVDPARLLRDAVAAGGPALERIDPSWTCQLAEPLVLSALEVGDRDAARHWAERARALAAHTRLPLASAKAASAEALVRSAEDDHETAVEHACEGLVRAAAGGPVHVALARSVLGRVLARAGEREQALRELQAAADALTACGQQRAHDVAAREIRRLGGRASGRVGRAAGAEGLRELTAREREIAALVADGVGNKQIGRTLHISDKTVANILSAIYAKLGLRGRTELAALVAGQPIDG